MNIRITYIVHKYKPSRRITLYIAHKYTRCTVSRITYGWCPETKELIDIKTIELVLFRFWPSFVYCHHHCAPRTHNPVEKGMDVPASQTSPSMNEPTVKVLASDALVITR